MSSSARHSHASAAVSLLRAKRQLLAAVGITGMLLPLGSVAMADEAPAANQPAASGDIIVTAQRRSEKLQDVPISVTAISAEKLHEANVQSLSDIAKLSPATRFDYQSSFVQPTIRGVGTAVVTAGGGSNVGIYEDGFYSPNPLAGDFQLLNVTGIQVLKGPQGTLFGRNSTGGAILVTSAKPSQQPTAIAEASYGSFNTADLKAYVSGGITDTIAADLEGAYKRSDGYVNNIDPTGPRHPGQLANWSVRAGLNVDLSPSASLLLRYTHSDVNDPTQLAAAIPVMDGINYAPQQYTAPAVAGNPGTLTPLPASQVATGYRQVAIAPNQVPFFVLQSDVYQLTGTFDLGFANLTSYTQYRIENTNSGEDQDETSAAISYAYVPVQDHTITQELLLNSKPGSRLQWTTGLFYFENVDQYKYVLKGTTAIDAAASPANIQTHERTGSIAGYANVTYEAIDNLFLSAGLRYSHDIADESFLTISNYGLSIPYANLKKDSVTPRAVIRYQIDPHTSVYGSYTKGYKAPLIDVVSGLTGNNANVQPETMNAFEVGYKHETRQFSFNVASWYYDYKNLQVSTYPYGLSAVDNAATARIYGFEGDTRYQITPDFEVNASAAYVNAKYKTFTSTFLERFGLCTTTSGPNANCNPGGGDVPGGWAANVPYNGSGSPLQRAPKFTATVGARYGLDLGGGRLTLSGTLYHTSSFAFDPEDQFIQKGYDLLGLRAEWTDTSKRFTIAAYGDNVNGAKYYTQVIQHVAAPAAVWAAPATWGVSVRVKY